MSGKRCELCSNPARIFCESDQACLCWDCDGKVHTANFLVAKHYRTLLCHICQSPTPWKAAGLKLVPTVSVCHGCADGDVVVNRGAAASSSRRDDEDGSGYDSPESESDDGEFQSDSEDFSEEDEENQVVPWSNSPPDDTAPSSGGCEENAALFSSKRTRENAFESEDENRCYSSGSLDLGSLQESDEKFGSSLSLLRPLKIRLPSSGGELLPSSEQAIEGYDPSSDIPAIVEKLRRFQQKIVTEKGEASAMILTHQGRD